jgi:recombination protein RecT
MENTLVKAATKTAVANTKKNKKPIEVVNSIIAAKASEIKKALPAVMTPERFSRITLSAISTNPVLAQAAVTSPMTLLGSVMTAAQLGLEPNTPLGHCYLIPRKRQGVWEVQFQLGYKGLIDLAYRSGEVTIIQAHCVYANDTFEYELGLDPKLRHVPASGNRGEMTHAYAVFKTKGGATGFACMTKEDLDQHRDKYSDAAKKGFSPWASQYEEMCKKTVLKAALKYAPLKSDFVRAVFNDETVKAEVNADMSEVAPIIDAEFTETAQEAVSEPLDGEMGKDTNLTPADAPMG